MQGIATRPIPGCTYFEHHAWGLGADGLVVDKTWGEGDQRDATYFGVAVPAKDLMDVSGGDGAGLDVAMFLPLLAEHEPRLLQRMSRRTFTLFGHVRCDDRR